jgi:peptide/nickel transport system substrate-binding protein
MSELDPHKAKDLSYQIDQKIWEEGHSVPLYQSPELIAAKSNIVNFGAFGFASIIYERIGLK